MKARNTDKNSHKAQDGPTIKNCLSPNVNSAKGEGTRRAHGPGLVIWVWASLNMFSLLWRTLN